MVPEYLKSIRKLPKTQLPSERPLHLQTPRCFEGPWLVVLIRPAMLEPRFSCTIPSIHDDTPLSVRIYHPDVLSTPLSSDSVNGTRWRKKGIVMAHPYAPMGGSYDDRIVSIVVDEFLKAGWVVGTFNFRGAYGAKGRTSWSGKPELEDYKSVAGFFMHYLSFLQLNPSSDATFSAEQSPVSPKANQPEAAPQAAATVAENEGSVVVLGGYSYGSLILRHLPPILSIIQPFSSPPDGSAANEILLRAHALSDQANLEWLNQARDRERQRRRGHEASLSVTMGGEETSPEKRRISREVKRSMDGHRSLDLSNRLRSLNHRRRNGDVTPTGIGPVSARPSITVPQVRYLLVSPLTAPTSTVLAPALARGFWNKSAQSNSQEAYTRHETLAVFGDQDVFSSAKKMRQWVEAMHQCCGTRFSHAEVNGAGHFWHEESAESGLREALRNWELQIKDVVYRT